MKFKLSPNYGFYKVKFTRQSKWRPLNLNNDKLWINQYFAYKKITEKEFSKLLILLKNEN